MTEEILEMRIDSLEDQVESLNKKLEITTKALKDISYSLWDEMECRGCAKKALKEMEEI